MKETYEIVKKISKKVYTDHPEQMEELKNRCRPMWIKHVGSEEGFDKTFKVVELSGAYIFNASHAYCVGGDGAEIAYCKANYPYETYEVCLNWFYRKGNKDKVSLLQQEMLKGFGIKVGEMKWGNDNTKFTADKDRNCIYPCLSAIKGMGKNCAKELYKLHKNKKYSNFFDLLYDIKDKTTIESGMIDTLIRLDYFSEFGKSQKLLKIVDIYNAFYKKEKGEIKEKKVFSKDKLPLGVSMQEFKKYSKKETDKQFREVDIPKMITEISKKIPDKDITLVAKLKAQLEFLGYISYKNEELKNYGYVLEEDSKYTPKVKIYRIDTGEIIVYKISRRIYKGLSQHDIIYIYGEEDKVGHKKVGEHYDEKKGKMMPDFEKDPNKIEKWIREYELINQIGLKY